MSEKGNNQAVSDTRTAQPRIQNVDLFDNGAPVGSAAVDPNGNWQLQLDELTEGMHIMTASSGNTKSGEWRVNVQSTSGSEDWSERWEQEMKQDNCYFLESGLMLIPTRISPTKAPRWARHTDGSIILIMENQTWFLFILPTTATRVVITTENAQTSPGAGIYFSSMGNIIEDVEYPSLRGENVYNLNRPARYISLGFWKDGYSNLMISKIAWDTPS